MALGIIRTAGRLAAILLLTTTFARTAISAEAAVRVLHYGFNQSLNKSFLLIDKGADSGITQDAVYTILANNVEIGRLRIQGVMPDSSVGAFEPSPGASTPTIGATVTLREPVNMDVQTADAVDEPKAAPLHPNEITEASAREYRLGPGDSIQINTWPRDLLPSPVTLRYDGTLDLPYVGALKAANLTCFELADTLKTKLSRDFKRPWVQVVVTEYKSKIVRALGEIATASSGGPSGPGEYPLKTPMRLLDFLSHIGGPTQNADKAKVTVTRRNGEIKNINLDQLAKNTQSSENFSLQDGDMIYVPSAAKATADDSMRVILLGKIFKPGALALSTKTGKLIDALAEAGGPLNDAQLTSVFIMRQTDPNNRKTMKVDLSRMAHGEPAPDIALQNGDLIFLPTKGKSAVEQFNSLIKNIMPSLGFGIMFDTLTE